MEIRGREMFATIFLLAMFVSAQGRAVNISNTWVLPEEGFPVFYRYFRDRISWYEADAVCQFHHANLVTVDTTAQYDALRAYLKELDISSAVWVGLIRSNPDGDFTWTDYRGLSSDGYWSAAPDTRVAPLCAAADPAADYRWEAMACGGPTVASFICELPVPQWALGNEGCMVRALPALTVLYLPESAAVQLTADCGLAGVKKVQCTGNVKREELLKDLSCVEEVEQTSLFNLITTFSVASDSTYSDLEIANETVTEDLTTNIDSHNKKQEIQTTTPHYLDTHTIVTEKSPINHLDRIYLEKTVTYLQSNALSKMPNNDNSLTNEITSSLSDEKHIQHKVHDEFSRPGNYETIYTQPTDHFVPPLVMAKAKISDDMTVLSLDEKHAQQFAVHLNLNRQDQDQLKNLKDYNKGTDNSIVNQVTTHLNSEVTFAPTQIIDYVRKDKSKQPKKYDEKSSAPKSKSLKLLENKLKAEKITSTTRRIETEATTLQPKEVEPIEDVPSIDLTVIIKEPGKNNLESIFYSNSTTSVTKTRDQINSTDFPLNSNNDHLTEINTSTNNPITTIQDIRTEQIEKNITSHEIIKITIVNNEKNSTSKSFEFTTKMPIFKDAEDKTKIISATTLSSMENPHESATTINTSPHNFNTAAINENVPETTSDNNFEKSVKSTTTSKPMIQPTVKQEILLSTTETPSVSSSTLSSSKNIAEQINIDDQTTTHEAFLVTDQEKIDIFNYTGTFSSQDEDSEGTDSEPINDTDSPLLSAASEPLHRPNRSRRPVQPNRINKFNPFRILG